MAKWKARVGKVNFDNRSFLDDAIYLYRSKNAKQGKWDIRLALLQHDAWHA